MPTFLGVFASQAMSILINALSWCVEENYFGNMVVKLFISIYVFFPTLLPVSQLLQLGF